MPQTQSMAAKWVGTGRADDNTSSVTQESITKFEQRVQTGSASWTSRKQGGERFWLRWVMHMKPPPRSSAPPSPLWGQIKTNPCNPKISPTFYNPPPPHPHESGVPQTSAPRHAPRANLPEQPRVAHEKMFPKMPQEPNNCFPQPRSLLPQSSHDSLILGLLDRHNIPAQHRGKVMAGHGALLGGQARPCSTATHRSTTRQKGGRGGSQHLMPQNDRLVGHFETEMSGLGGVAGAISPTPPFLWNYWSPWGN